MTKNFASITAAAVVALAIPSVADARTQMRAVGSSTVYPFAKIVSERIGRANPKLGTPIIESTGTGAGMKLFCAGVGERFPDVENASRRMKASEAKLCTSNGVTQVTEIQVGLDGVTLATAKSTPLSNVSQRDIYLAIAKTPFGRPNTAKTSGTRDALGELIMTPPCEANGSMAAMKKADPDKFKAICTGVRSDGAYIETGENDNLIVQKLESNPGTIGIFGFSYLEENASRLKGLQINGVSPTYQTISAFQYPGSRPLYIYLKNAHANAIPAIRAYAAEFTKESAFGPNGYLRTQAGMIAAPNNIRARSQQAARALSPLNFASLK